ncbi:MAG TPA: ABC transporter ATP-binding protein [Gaiellaceae bacterium]|jgi:oligopeptide/dipeptide ABC transporter ATP-binding protein|nr:ABC transporter ATP-binding protein [Gaiellaceae bacterium]
MEPRIVVEDLSVRFTTRRGEVHAVSHVGFEVPRGKAVGIVGETGSGKSATVKAVMGLLPPAGRIAGGSVRLDGEELVGASRRRLRQIRGARLGFVGQSPFAALNPVIPIQKQFLNALRAHSRWSAEDARARALAMLEAAGIVEPERVLKGYAHELSGGMAQRVVIAIALSLGAEVLIADEPTTALDATVQRQVLDTIRSLVSESERSLLIVTHDLGVVAQYCDEVVVMYAGRVVEAGTVEGVFTSPAHPYTAGLLASIPDGNHRLIGIPGAVPTLFEEPRGCTFAPRCLHTRERCEREEPQGRAVGGSRSVRCHFSEAIREEKHGAPVSR